MELNLEKLQVWFHYYSLKRKTKANAATVSSEQHGALIKIQDELGHEGFADLCPWPSLGDLPLSEEIKTAGPLFQRSIELAKKDLLARKNKMVLVSSEPIKNNILISDYHALTIDFNFSEHTVKIKGDTNIQALALLLNTHVNRFFKIRLDFNFCLSENQFSDFISSLKSEALKKISYIEDPFAFDEKKWKTYSSKVKLALDWKKSPDQNLNFLIQKPTRAEVNDRVNSTLTSSMDHPIGIVHGLYYAQQYPANVHGFATLDQYEDTAFHSYFKHTQGEMIYESDGCGIGFETLFRKINWVPGIDLAQSQETFLLANPRLQPQELADLFEIKKQFNEQIPFKDYILIPSSGSTQNKNESVKVIALKKQALIQSAMRVNQEFQIDDQANWGCLLPLFHVGGLGIHIRAKLSGGKVFYQSWNELTLEWLNENKITHLSLVPTQIYEIVQKNWQAPKCLKAIFVGGDALNSELAKKALDLGWPMVATFGMTETASMIAAKKDIFSEYYDVLKGVEIQSQDSLLKVKSNSNADYILKLNLTDRKLQIEKVPEWLSTSDQVQVIENRFKFLQRESDFIKIKGEGVSLFELREKLKSISNDVFLCDFVDARDGAVLRLIASTANQDIKTIINKFNNLVRPFEKINSWVELSEIPLTDLNKVKYNQIKEMKDLNVKKV